MNNTEITYIHRDDNNRKYWFSVVLKGSITEEQKEIIIDCLYDKKYGLFYPEAVHLPYDRFQGEIFEWMENSVLPTKKEPTLYMTMDELVENFQKAKDHWEYYDIDISR